MSVNISELVKFLKPINYVKQNFETRRSTEN